jgi:hypothetical protein
LCHRLAEHRPHEIGHLLENPYRLELMIH